MTNFNRKSSWNLTIKTFHFIAVERDKQLAVKWPMVRQSTHRAPQIYLLNLVTMRRDEGGPVLIIISNAHRTSWLASHNRNCTTSQLRRRHHLKLQILILDSWVLCFQDNVERARNIIVFPRTSLLMQDSLDNYCMIFW